MLIVAEHHSNTQLHTQLHEALGKSYLRMFQHNKTDILCRDGFFDSSVLAADLDLP